MPNECICRQGYGGTNCGTGDVQCLHVWGVHGVGILECGIGIQNAHNIELVVLSFRVTSKHTNEHAKSFKYENV